MMTQEYFLFVWFKVFVFVASVKDDARCQLGALQRKVEELMQERDSAQSRVTQLQSSFQEYQEGLFFPCDLKK